MKELTPQQKAALVFDKHVSVTANAGSGKTFVLSKRFVEIFLNADVDLNSIVAITFTDKAAGELKRKIANEVDERLLLEVNPEKRKKLENLRRQLVSANISTIHSFCINILKEFAPEAEIDANFNPIDKTTSDELIELSVDETINSLIQNQSYKDDLKYLIRFFTSKRGLVSQLQNAVEKRRVIENLKVSRYDKSEDEIAEIFKENFENSFDMIFADSIEQTILALKKINEFVIGHDSANKHAAEAAYVLNQINSEAKPIDKLILLKHLVKNALTEKLMIRKPGYLNKQREKFENEIDLIHKSLTELSNFFSVDLSGESEKELAKFGKSFIKVYDYLLNLYTEKKKKNGYLDFEDLLLKTEKILEFQNVINSLRQKFRYVMIDEYQDTNELQYEIFMPILENLQSGNLFVVGDEKQSIYLFRNAEPEIFERTKNEILYRNQSGELLTLPHSFRMTPPLVLFTNHLFTNLFKNPNTYFNEVKHSQLVCAKEENQKGAAEIILADEDTVTTESDLVARRILQLLADETDDTIIYKNIAVLCRKRDSFVELEDSFVRYGIPFTIIGGKGFYQRQTIYDVYNYISFLLNTENDSALIGILRSPFFNISDLQLYQISLASGNSYFEKIKNIPDSEIKNIFEKLNENLNLASSMEISKLIRKVLLESSYWAIIAAKQNSNQELANIEKLLTLARSYSQKSFKNLYDFNVFLREAIEGYEDEGQAQVARDENTVKLLTIHQAKGLEYKAVFLYGCNNTTRDDSVRAKSLSVDKNYGLLTKVPVLQKYFEKYSTPPIVALYNYSNERKNCAEMKRLLYVGVTRAISHLFITATHKNYNVKSNSFLELIIEGFNLDPQSEKIELNSNVEFMKFIGDKYEFYQRPISLSIPIIHQIDEVKIDELQKAVENATKINLTQKITDVPKSEIISATKISMFSQCPVKYQLTYELGYSRIYNLIKENEDGYEFNENEEYESRSFRQIRGKIIHAALKENYRGEELRSYIVMKMDAENIDEDDLSKENMVTSIIGEIEQFYHSEAYNELVSSKNSKSELEIYCEEGEHYLYGIIDKLIIDNDKLVIVDYKTDNITEEQLNDRAGDYMPQLKFYAYILSKLFTLYNTFELRLLFLKHSHKPITRVINREELKLFGDEIRDAVEKIYTSQFKPNLIHCSKCHFALEGNRCVKPGVV